MKSILMPRSSTQMANILNGKQSIIFTRTAPKCELPATVYLYCNKSAPYLHPWTDPVSIDLWGPKGALKVTWKTTWRLDNAKWYMSRNGKIVAKFTLRKIEELKPFPFTKLLDDGLTEKQKEIADKGCVGWLEIHKYMNHKHVYMWEISDLQIFDEAKELTTKAPQSWCYYVE